MIANSEKAYVRGFGRLPVLAGARFTTVNGATPTVVHQAGVETIAYVSEGIWDLTLSNDVLDVLPSGLPFATVGIYVGFIAADGATIPHQCGVISFNQATGVARVYHLQGSALATPTYSLQDAPGIDIMVLFYSLEA